MATQPAFAATPRRSGILINTANTNTDGTGGGSFPTVFTAGANGSKLDSVQIKGIVAEGATQAADTVRLWLVNGGTKLFLKEQLVPAGGGVVSATVANAEFTIALGIPLAAGDSVVASTKVGGATASYHVQGFGGDY